jgi:hypothetical protein
MAVFNSSKPPVLSTTVNDPDFMNIRKKEDGKEKGREGRRLNERLFSTCYA